MVGCVGLQVASTGISAVSAYYARKVYVSPSECDWVKPIYIEGQLDGLTREDKELMAVHNEHYFEFCEKD